jgi:hypothetical protein
MEAMCCPLDNGDADADPAQFYNQRVLRAAKEHECSECSAKIAKGERYERVDAMWDGDWSMFKTCLLCVEIRNHFACGNGWCFGEVWNQLEENFFPDMKAGGPCIDPGTDRSASPPPVWVRPSNARAFDDGATLPRPSVDMMKNRIFPS